MDIILDNLKLIIGVAVAFFWIIGKISESKKASQQQRDEQEPWQPDEDYENWEPEAAQGGQPPPIPYGRTGAPPPLPMFVAASEEELNRQRVMQEKLAALRSQRNAASSAKKAPGKKTVVPAAPASLSIKARLRDRKEVRRAFVMREILDPPVGMR